MTKKITHIRNGVIIRNSLEVNGSWTKRVKHWQLSFGKKLIKTNIVTCYPSKPKAFINGTEEVYYLVKWNLPNILLYIISPFTLLCYLIKSNPQFVLLAQGGFWEFWILPVYCKLKKIPLLIDVVDTIGKKYKKNKSLSDYLILYNKNLFDLLVLRQSNEIFVISSELETKYKFLYPQKKITRSLPTTVDIEQFKSIAKLEVGFLNCHEYDIFNDRSTLKIFYAGTVARTNGIEFFLSAVSEIMHSIGNKISIIFAVILGDIDQLRMLLDKYNLTQVSKIVPPVEQKYLPILLSRANILFIPEQGYETANAGFPGKTAEYLMSGNPIITTDFSDLSNYLVDGQNSCITRLGDLFAYKNNLQRLILEPAFRYTIGSNGQELAIRLFSHLNSADPYFSSVNSFYTR